MINLVMQSFGREYEYRRAILTVLSFYAHVSAPRAEIRVILFTDKPSFFEPYLKALPIDYCELTPEKISAMRGAIDFLHRMKIAIIEEAFSRASGDLLYVDSDTFFISDPVPKLKQLDPGISFMHLCEYSFDTLKDAELPAGKSFRAVYSLIEQKKFLYADGSSFSISPRQYSWNAGVMFLHSSVSVLLPDIYVLTDQLYPATHNHASEQYAFSVILQGRTEIRPCDDVVYHYWYRIKKQIMDSFLGDHLGQKWTDLILEQKLKDVMGWTQCFPTYLDKHILTLRDRAIQCFNTNQFGRGYGIAFRAILRDPFNIAFMRDVFYHTRRFITRTL